MRYFIELAQGVREVETTDHGVRLGDRATEADIATVPGGRRRHLRLDTRGRALVAYPVEDGWMMEVAGRRVQVTIEDERAHAIRELAPSRPGAAAREVRAPMAGLILKVEIEPGQRVAPGTGLLIIEAMKMENEIRAEADGTVATIEVTEGQTVNPRDLLLTFEGEEPTGD